MVTKPVDAGCQGKRPALRRLDVRPVDGRPAMVFVFFLDFHTLGLTFHWISRKFYITTGCFSGQFPGKENLHSGCQYVAQGGRGGDFYIIWVRHGNS